MNRSASIAASFVALVEKSNLLTPEELDRARKLIPAEADAKTAANLLIQHKLLTRWQAAQILAGRTALTLGKYRLLERLGKGGMGSVYLAEHRQMKRRAAIKTLPVEAHQDPAAESRLLAEAQAIAMLDHRNIVHAFDLEVDGDLHFLVMEYVEGEDLQQLVERTGPLAFEQAADYMTQAADGLAHLHGRGMVHRDIKPANLLLDRQGTIKITDLGLAHGGDQTTSVPRPASQPNAIGTVDYLSPEQALDHDSADQRSDIYSLGCTFYFLLTGQPPFPEGSLAERLVKHQTEEPRSILKLRPDAPHDLVKACRKMMAKKPEQRFPSTKEIATLLRGWQPASPDAATSVLEESSSRPKGTSDTAISRSGTSLNPNRPPQGLQPGSSGPLRQVGTATPRGGMPVARPLDAEPAGVSGIRARGGARVGTASSKGRTGASVSSVNKKKRKTTYLLLSGLALFLALIGGMMAMVLNSSKPQPDTATVTNEPSQSASKSASTQPPASATPSAPRSRDDAVKASIDKPATKPAVNSTTKSSATSAPPASTKVDPEQRPEPKQGAKPSEKEPFKAVPRLNPFRELAKAVDLPAMRRVDAEGDTPPVDLGKVYAPQGARYEIELIGGAIATAKGTGQFHMSRQESDLPKTTWLISFDAGSEAKGTPVGLVSRNNDDLQFQWAAGATKAPADHLRNCALQLNVGDAKQALLLRKAKETSPIPVDISKERSSYPVQCEFLPDPETLFVEVLDLEGARGLESEMRPARFSVRTPATPREQSTAEPTTIYIGDPKTDGRTKPMALRLGCLVRGRTVRFEVQPMYQSNDTWAPLVASKLAQAMSDQKAKLDALTTRIGVLNPERNKKDLADAKKDLEEVQAVVKDLEKLRALYTNVQDKAQIHYRLIHPVGDQEIMLLSTRAADTK